MSSYRHATSYCPTCGSGFDSASPQGPDEKPKPGDLSVCLYCGTWLVFDDAGLPVLIPTDEEMEQAEPELLAEANELRQLWNERQKH